MFQQLADDINEFLQREILSKHEDDRTKKEDFLLETGRAFADALVRYASGHTGAPGPMPKTESLVVGALKSMNDINREYDLRNVEAGVLERARKGRG